MDDSDLLYLMEEYHHKGLQPPMLTIELSHQQADELMSVLLDQIQYLTEKMTKADPVEEMECQCLRHTLSEIHHLLEIA